MDDFTTLLEAKDVKISRLQDLLQQEKSQGPGTNIVAKVEIDRLKADNAWLVESNASLSKEVKSLTEQLLQAHTDANSLLNIFLQSFSPHPPPS